MLFTLLFHILILYESTWTILFTMKKYGTYGKENYSKGELAQLARRRMVQKDHGDSSKYSRKNKHKNTNYE